MDELDQFTQSEECVRQSQKIKDILTQTETRMLGTSQTPSQLMGGVDLFETIATGLLDFMAP